MSRRSDEGAAIGDEIGVKRGIAGRGGVGDGTIVAEIVERAGDVVEGAGVVEDGGGLELVIIAETEAGAWNRRVGRAWEMCEKLRDSEGLSPFGRWLQNW